MKNIELLFSLIVFMLLHLNLFSQNDNNVFQILEDSGVSDENAERLLEAIDKRNNNLIQIYNINDLSREDMILLGLDNFQILSLQNYLDRTGDILSLNELQFINGFDRKTIDFISPYLYAERKKRQYPLKFDSVFKYSKQSLRFQFDKNLKTPYGFTRTDGKGFKGENFASSFRYNFKYYNRLEFSFVGDKDYGEPIYYAQKVYGYDHYAVSFTLRDISKYLKQITVGDYRLNFGEGLSIKQNFSLDYFSEGYGVKHSNASIMPFRSTLEYDYNSGIAAKLSVADWDMVLFGSYNKIDYNGKSIQKTGYHRTQKELDRKNSNFVTLGGANIQYNNRGLSIGFVGFAYCFADSVKKGSQAYQRYDFNGTHNNIFAVNSSYSYKKIIVFTEIAKSMNNAFAELLGMQLDFSYKHNLSVVFRNYDRGYQNHYADALGLHSHNERGIYVNYSRFLDTNISYFIGADIYYFPFLSYRADKSSYGQKIKAKLNYKPAVNQSLQLYFKLNNHQYNITKSNGTKDISDNIVSQLQIKYRYDYSDCLSFVSRAGYSHFFTHDSRKNNGYFAYMELLSKFPNRKYSLDVRYTFFNAKDYDNRFYIYEYSLPLSFSSAMLYGYGHRFYAICGCKISSDFNIYLRYNVTLYNDTEEISSQNNLVKGNNLQYLSAQCLWNF